MPWRKPESRRLGVLDGELQALAEADLAGSTTCAAVAVELISRRLGALGQPMSTQEPAP